MAAVVDEDKVYVAADGGVEDLERLFRISDAHSPSPLPLDAVFVSFDLETSGRTSKGQRDIARVNRKEVSGIREVGFAVLDTRSIFPASSQRQAFNESTNEKGKTNENKKKPTRPQISTQQFSTLHASEDFEDCDFTDFTECVFAKTYYVAKQDLVATITSCLQFPSNAADHQSTGLRTVVMVGQSPQRDLEIIRQLGVELHRVAPIAAILDTHRLSKCILGPASPLVVAGQRSALRKHALSDILTELGVPYHVQDLHNAGNDATYTLQALILLAVRWAECMEELTPEQSAHVERLRAFARAEFEAPRWKPVRRALGAHLSLEEITPPVKKLGSGLESLVKSGLRLSSLK